MLDYWLCSSRKQRTRRCSATEPSFWGVIYLRLKSLHSAQVALLRKKKIPNIKRFFWNIVWTLSFNQTYRRQIGAQTQIYCTVDALSCASPVAQQKLDYPIRLVNYCLHSLIKAMITYSGNYFCFPLVVFASAEIHFEPLKFLLLLRHNICAAKLYSEWIFD